MSERIKRGVLVYDEMHGMVCHGGHPDTICSRHLRTVTADGAVTYTLHAQPTESGSYLYVCPDCGASAWSGV